MSLKSPRRLSGNLSLASRQSAYSIITFWLACNGEKLISTKPVKHLPKSMSQQLSPYFLMETGFRLFAMRAGSTICGVAVCGATSAMDAFPHEACSRVALEKSANITWASTSSPLNSKGLQLPGEAYPLSLAIHVSSVASTSIDSPARFISCNCARSVGVWHRRLAPSVRHHPSDNQRTRSFLPAWISPLKSYVQMSERLSVCDTAG